MDAPVWPIIHRATSRCRNNDMIEKPAATDARNTAWFAVDDRRTTNQEQVPLYKDGHVFHRMGNNVWLVDHVPPAY